MNLRPLPYNKSCRQCAKLLRKGEVAWFGKHEGALCTDCHAEANGKPVPAPQPDTPVPVPAPDAPVHPRRPRKPGPAGAYPAAARCDDGIYRYEWESVSDLVDDAFCDRATAEATRADIARRISNNEGGKWANHHTVASIKAAVGKPAKKLIDAIDAMRQSLADDAALPVIPRRKIRHGREDGQELDPDRWLVREPMAWDRSEREPRPRNCIAIGVNMSVHAGQKPEELLYRGAAACALADMLTTRGMNVAITGFLVVHKMSEGCGDLVSKVELKSSNMPLDMAGLATSACDIGFFRLVMVYATARHTTGHLDGALGYPAGLPDADRKGFDFVLENTVRSKADAEEWLQENVRAMNAGNESEGGAQ